MSQCSDSFDLQRFVSAQQPVYATALAELKAGAKRTHWMWFIFPQVAGLGHSAMAQRFAIRSMDEAVAYLAHPLLGTRLAECTQAMLSAAGSAHAILGSPDDVKFRPIWPTPAPCTARRWNASSMARKMLRHLTSSSDGEGPEAAEAFTSLLKSGGTPFRLDRLQPMSEDDEIPEIAAPPMAVEETNRLFRLTPVAEDLSQANRQMALVAADTEEEARRIATLSDPRGRDWRDTSLFVADSMETPERHVVGDLVFRSTSSPLATRKSSGSRDDGAEPR
jgi:uncharacterized protein (DUF1810 family)